MSSIYTIIDKFGFLVAYDSYNKAKDFIKDWKKKVSLLIIEFPLCEESQKEEVYFIPYCGLESDSRFPLALVTNNKSKALKTQKALINMELTYPDELQFFTKKMNSINPMEFYRLTNNQLRIKEQLFDSLINKINEADSDTLDVDQPFDKFIAGLIWEPGDLLKNDSEEIISIHENS